MPEPWTRSLRGWELEWWERRRECEVRCSKGAGSAVVLVSLEHHPSHPARPSSLLERNKNADCSRPPPLVPPTPFPCSHRVLFPWPDFEEEADSPGGKMGLTLQAWRRGLKRGGRKRDGGEVGRLSEGDCS